MLRRILCFTLVLNLLVLFICPAYAAAPDTVEPLYDKISTVYANLSINEDTGIVTCTGRVTAKNTYPVSVYVQLHILENGSWRQLKSWQKSGTLTAYCSQSYAVYSGYTYRVTVTGYVYNDSGIAIESGSTSHSVYYPSN